MRQMDYSQDGKKYVIETKSKYLRFSTNIVH